MKKGANSGKQQRLKLKVARSTTRSTTTRTPGANVTIEHEAAHDFRLKGVPKDLFTVFHVREAQYEVDKRVNAARQPLSHRVDMQTHDGQLYQETISIPLRPPWTASTKAKRLQQHEEESFEAYLEDIYRRYPPHRLNHFEHNINVWRQLWRVCEMSDILILSADARHPLFHFPPSLYHYVTVTLAKQLVLVVNKVDLVDGDTLAGWVRYFRWKYPAVRVVCFSSFANGERVVSDVLDVEQRVKERRKEGSGRSKEVSGVKEVMEILEAMADEKQHRATGAAHKQERVDHSGVAKVEDATRPRRGRAREREAPDDETDAAVESKEQSTEQEHGERKEQEAALQTTATDNSATATDDGLGLPARTTVRARRLQRAGRAEATPQQPQAEEAEQAVKEAEVEEEEEQDELYNLQPASSRPSRDSILVVGVIGHPNAGKSSFINSLFGRPVVSASDTPGHTKHLQSLALTPRIAVVVSQPPHNVCGMSSTAAHNQCASVPMWLR